MSKNIFSNPIAIHPKLCFESKCESKCKCKKGA